ncbi:LamG-like jellyroll fold domain-containing protein [Rubellicoccus peritrichatus]|uniref:LamG-like jellyroll fold domain-containing protein n=1 Tax=Rubellicoccus peritrichatus TaxID=3080537 RepID=A0AAQ3QU42_9BACT|nr:LamG-like jellyroll fold domain-containing protein [Puniceicoccus sp. CR14]WOO40068.1 LamG-like jellyroll fold domain-containing protein [Puniceicoccus sp. CR14]
MKLMNSILSGEVRRSIIVGWLFSSFTVLYGNTLAYWQFDDATAGEVAVQLISEVNDQSLTSLVSSVGGGVVPMHVDDVPGYQITEGVDGTVINDTNTSSILFTAEDSSNGGIISFQDQSPLDDLLEPSSFTIELFVKSTTTQTFTQLIHKGLSGSAFSWANAIDWRQNVMSLRVDSLSPFAADKLIPSTPVFIDGAWHHIALTYDAVTTTFTLYQDYQSLGSLVKDIVYDDSALNLGTALAGGCFDGLIDEVRFSDRVLPVDEFMVAVNDDPPDPTWQSVEKNTRGNPLGYYEFLPSDYYLDPSEPRAIIIFFHGNGERGDGFLAAPGQSIEGKLNEVEGVALPRMLRDSQYGLRNFFNENGAIVLCPQSANWWGHAEIRSFLDWVKSYYVLDSRRLYMTGLSAGSSGIASFVNNDAAADELAAIILVAVRGSISEYAASVRGKHIPTWALTAIGDVGYVAEASVNRIAGAMVEGPPTNVVSTYPGGSDTYTASFDPISEIWQWELGFVKDTGVHPKLTYFSGNSHATWDRTYRELIVWQWLFEQVKPEVEILSPQRENLLVLGESVDLIGSSVAIDGTDISSLLNWSSDLDGDLGAGATVLVDSLSVGVHRILCKVVDSGYRINRKSVLLTVLYGEPFRALVDFGPQDSATAGSWNNLFDPIDGAVPNAIDDQGVSTGVRISVRERFDRTNASGVVDSTLHPSAAQQDSFFVSDAYPRAELIISGLNPVYLYDFSFFASRQASNDRTAIYTICGQSVVLNAANNTGQSVSLNQARPNELGEVALVIERGPNATYGYLGVLEIVSPGTDDRDQDALGDVWELDNFSTLQYTGDQDFDSDGSNNFIEYALGSDATNPSENLAQVPVRYFPVQGGDGSMQNYLEIRYLRRKGDKSISYQTLVSDDLMQWGAGVGTYTTQEVTPSTEDGLEIVIERDMTPIDQSNGARFMRLMVEPVAP